MENSKKNKADELLNSLEKYIPHYFKKLDSDYQNKLLKDFKLRLEACLSYSETVGKIGQSTDSLEAVFLDKNKSKGSSIKVANFSLNIFKWFDISWKTISLITSQSAIGAWIAIGILLVIRDLVNLANIQISNEQGEILFTLWTLTKKKNEKISYKKLLKGLKLNFDHVYNINELTRILTPLENLKCIENYRSEKQIKLIERIFVF